MKQSISSNAIAQRIEAIDSEHSQRFIALDPLGYFIIKLSEETNEIVVEHYSNHIYILLMPLIFKNYLRYIDKDTKNLYKLKILLK